MDDYIRRLRQIREESGLTLEKVSDELGMSEGLLTLVELGEVLPTEKQLGKIAEFVIDQL